MISTKGTVTVEGVVCHRMEIAVQSVLKGFVRRHPELGGFARNAELQITSQDIDREAEELVAYLSSWVLAPSHPEKGYLTFEYKVPATWFDHLKQSIKYGVHPRWVPSRLWAWLMGKITVKLTLKTMTKEYVKNINVCPHGNVKFPDHTHIRFMMDYPSARAL